MPVVLNEVGVPVFVRSLGGTNGAKGPTGDAGAAGAPGAAGAYNYYLAKPYLSGKWYLFPGHLLGTLAGQGANIWASVPFVAHANHTITDLSVYVTAAQAASNCKLAIYAAGSDRKPTGAPLAATADIATIATGAASGALGAPLALVKGTLYHAACHTSTAGVNCSGCGGIGDVAHSIFGGELSPPSDMILTQSLRSGFRLGAQAYASGLPDVTAAVWGTQNFFVHPLIAFKSQ